MQCAKCGTENPDDSLFCGKCGVQTAVSTTTSVSVVSAEERAGFWSRSLAMILDIIAVGIINEILAYSLFGPASRPEDIKFSLTLSQGGILMIVIWIVYYTFFIGKLGQTLGKMVMNIKVVKEDGSQLNYLEAFLRCLCYFINFGIGFLIIGFKKDKRGLHDIIRGTKVIKVKQA